MKTTRPRIRGHDFGVAVRYELVPYDDVTRLEFGDEHLYYVGQEHCDRRPPMIVMRARLLVSVNTPIVVFTVPLFRGTAS